MNNKIVKSNEVITLLKKEELYLSDNGVEREFDHVSSLENTNSTSLSWIRKSKYDLSDLNSSTIIVGESFKCNCNDKSIIFTKNPQLAIIYIINEFFLNFSLMAYIDNSSSINLTVKVGKNVYIERNVVVGENCIIGDNVKIFPNCVIYPNTVIGNGVVINAGTTIGQEGFGYIKNLDGNNIQFPHIGKVIIEDNVEIGANTCIDRGALSDTVIGKNTKIDNLVHIAHNVVIGKNCLIAAKVEISGSTSIGDDVYIGPNATIIDVISIGVNAVIGMGAIVRNNVKENSTIVPFESFEIKDYVIKRKVLNDLSNR